MHVRYEIRKLFELTHITCHQVENISHVTQRCVEWIVFLLIVTSRHKRGPHTVATSSQSQPDPASFIESFALNKRKGSSRARERSTQASVLKRKKHERPFLVIRWFFNDLFCQVIFVCTTFMWEGFSQTRRGTHSYF